MNPKIKKLLIIIAIVLVFFGVFFIVLEYRNNKVNYVSAEENETTQELVQRINLIDSDEDGLKDWEEILWKTDPNNPDSDGDGMNDNDEVLNQRDPLVKGEGSLNNITTTQKNNSLENTQTTLTQTDILAREIFTGYVALKQNGTLGTEEQEIFIKKITSSNLEIEQDINYLTLNDIKIVYDSSKETLQKYADELKTVFSKNPTLRDDNVILKESLDNEDPEILEEIKSNTVFYKSFIDSLIQLEVPNEIKNYHLNLINLFEQMIGDTKQMVLVFEDPILGLAGAKNYSNTTNKVIDVSVELGKYFKKKNINF